MLKTDTEVLWGANKTSTFTVAILRPSEFPKTNQKLTKLMSGNGNNTTSIHRYHSTTFGVHENKSRLKHTKINKTNSVLQYMTVRYWTPVPLTIPFLGHKLIIPSFTSIDLHSWALDEEGHEFSLNNFMHPCIHRVDWTTRPDVLVSHWFISIYLASLCWSWIKFHVTH